MVDVTELRESPFYRLRWMWVAIGLAVGVAIALLLSRAGDANVAAWCRAEYSRAATAADSMTVDAMVPARERPDGSPRLACGVVRRTGGL